MSASDRHVSSSGRPLRGVATATGLLAGLPTALVLVAEAAWVAVLAALLQAFTLEPASVGFWTFLVAAAAGLVATRLLAVRAGDRWPGLAAALAIGCGAIAWLSSAAVRDILVAEGVGGLGRAIAANLGGWFASVAFVRGIAHSRLPADPRRIGNLLGLAIPGLAILALVGGMVSEPFRSGFLAEAQAEVLLFLVTAILALALARLGLIAKGAAVDWRRNPAWLALLVVLLLGTAIMAIVVSVVAGPAIVMALGALFAPLLVVGFFVGFDRRSFAIVLLSVIGMAGIATILQAFAGRNAAPPPSQPEVTLPIDPTAGAVTPVTLSVLGIVLAVAVVALLILARLWLRRSEEDELPVPETREIDRGGLESGRRRVHRFGFARRRAPHDAVAAYRTLLEDLEPDPDARRLPGETPAEHAARLRAAGRGALALDLLAADYGLVRFGGFRLTPREERRALGRVSTLRRRLLRH